MKQKGVSTDRQRLIKLIHVAKRELALDDESYRDILLRIGGKASSADMSASELNLVLEHMRHAGFKYRAVQSRRLADDDQSKMIRGLWLQLHELGAVRSTDESALAAFIKRMTGTEALQWLSSRKASMVIEQLKKWRQRTIHHPLEKLLNKPHLTDEQVSEFMEFAIGEHKSMAQITRADMDFALSQLASWATPPTSAGDAS